MRAYRVQAADGRGPWRPGYSQTWIDDDAPVGRLTETLMDLMPLDKLRALPTTMQWGCACRSLDELMSWFSPVERERLEQRGFFPVCLNVDRVLAEGKYQILIGRSRPFAEGATRLRWPSPRD